MSLFIGLQASSCGPHEVDGRTVEQAFRERKMANLAAAACAGDKDGIAAALRQGASPNGLGVPDKFGVVDTPLTWAVTCANLDGIELLVKAGGNPNFKTPDRHYSPREVADMGRFPPDPIDVKGVSATYVASGLSDAGPLRLLLKYGGDPNAYEGREAGQTALENAFLVGYRKGQWDGYYALLDAGANINAGCDGGNAIGALAALYVQFDKVEDLLKRGYVCDLGRLAMYVGRDMNLTSQPLQDAARSRVLALLRARGVHLPVHEQ